MKLGLDKRTAYAVALPDDISATRFEVVENGVLWRGYIGTVYGMMVGTDCGYKFDTFAAARLNAELFVEQCREAVK